MIVVCLTGAFCSQCRRIRRGTRARAGRWSCRRSRPATAGSSTLSLGSSTTSLCRPPRPSILRTSYSGLGEFCTWKYFIYSLENKQTISINKNINKTCISILHSSHKDIELMKSRVKFRIFRIIDCGIPSRGGDLASSIRWCLSYKCIAIEIKQSCNVCAIEEFPPA